MADAKKYLQQIQLYDKHINARLEELFKLKEMILNITSTLKQDVVSSTGSQDKLGDAVIKIVDLENEINSEVDFYVDSKENINKTLNKIEDSDQFEILHKRYVQYKTWEEIACEMNMTYRNVCYIHGKALHTVSKIINGDSNE